MHNIRVRRQPGLGMAACSSTYVSTYTQRKGDTVDQYINTAGRGTDIIRMRMEKYRIKKKKKPNKRNKIKKYRRGEERKDKDPGVGPAGCMCASNSGSRGSTRRRHVRYARKPARRTPYGICIYLIWISIEEF